MGTILLFGILLIFGILLFFWKKTGHKYHNQKTKNKFTKNENFKILDNAQQEFLKTNHQRIEIKGNEIHIKNHFLYAGASFTQTQEILLEGLVPEIKIYETASI